MPGQSKRAAAGAEPAAAPAKNAPNLLAAAPAMKVRTLKMKSTVDEHFECRLCKTEAYFLTAGEEGSKTVKCRTLHPSYHRIPRELQWVSSKLCEVCYFTISCSMADELEDCENVKQSTKAIERDGSLIEIFTSRRSKNIQMIAWQEASLPQEVRPPTPQIYAAP
jgi:hypothetical protein